MEDVRYTTLIIAYLPPPRLHRIVRVSAPGVCTHYAYQGELLGDLYAF